MLGFSRVPKQASRDKALQFTALLHHVTPEQPSRVTSNSSDKQQLVSMVLVSRITKKISTIKSSICIQEFTVVATYQDRRGVYGYQNRMVHNDH
jgi:hypothetical protein